MSGGRRHGRPAPLQQGELDGLCGLYAIINAIRWSVGERGGLVGRQVDNLFGWLIEEVERTAGGMAAVALGIHDRPLIAIARASERLLADEFGFRVRVSHPFRPRPPATVAELVRVVRAATERDQVAFLIGLKGRYLHWSVCVGATRHHLVLYDSADIHRLRISCCRLDHQRRRTGGGVEHELCPRTILRFQPMGSPRSAHLASRAP